MRIIQQSVLQAQNEFGGVRSSGTRAGANTECIAFEAMTRGGCAQ
jgi:hypothetical protein